MLIGYARVSTEGQELQPQLDALAQAGCERTFSEKMSGAHTDRPQLTAAIDYAREGDTLVVWKLDRLGRDMKGLVDLAAELDQKKIGLRSLTDNVDTSGPAGRFFFNIMAAFAVMERELMRERTVAGIEAARARGKALGPPNKLSVDKRALGLRLLANPELTITEVARILGVAPITIYRNFAPHERTRGDGRNGGRPRKVRKGGQLDFATTPEREQALA